MLHPAAINCSKSTKETKYQGAKFVENQQNRQQSTAIYVGLYL